MLEYMIMSLQPISVSLLRSAKVLTRHERYVVADLECRDCRRDQPDQSLRRRSFASSLPFLILLEQIMRTHELSCLKWLLLFTDCDNYMAVDPIQWWHKTEKVFLWTFDFYRLSPTISLTSTQSYFGLMWESFISLTSSIRTWLSPHTSLGSTNPILTPTLFNPNHIILMTVWCVLHVQLTKNSIIPSD